MMLTEEESVGNKGGIEVVFVGVRTLSVGGLKEIWEHVTYTMSS
jgi:hypothetical protein